MINLVPIHPATGEGGGRVLYEISCHIHHKELLQVDLWNSLPSSAVSAAAIDVFKDKPADVNLNKSY